MKCAILYITDNGFRLAQLLKSLLTDAEIVRFAPGVIVDLWDTYEAFVFIMASGIAVRTIAPMLKDKKTDPAVVVLDEAGKYAVSLVGGHLGGANELAKKIAGLLGGEAVITTASDVNRLPSLDLWARDHGLVIEDWGLLPQLGTRLVNSGALRVYSDLPIDLPEEFLRVAEARYGDIIITYRKNVYAGGAEDAASGESCSTGACRVKGQLYLRPRNLVIGIGCNSGTPCAEIESAVKDVMDEGNLSFFSVAAVATIDIKGREPGLQEFVEKNRFDLCTFRPDELNRADGIEKSDLVFKATGAYGVAEPSALLAAGAEKLLVSKQKKGNVTVAVALKKDAECGARNAE